VSTTDATVVSGLVEPGFEGVRTAATYAGVGAQAKCV
jgi:hypothetical protein